MTDVLADGCLSVFVYGSLKRGFLRGNCWPRSPRLIRPAIISAKLYDLGPYPAICLVESVPDRSNATIQVAHDDKIENESSWVLGELWSFDRADFEATLECLDKIEGFDPRAKIEDCEYIRREAWVWTEEGEAVRAMTYEFAHRFVLEKVRLIPASQTFLGRSVAVWPDAMARVPKSFQDEPTLFTSTPTDLDLRKFRMG